MTPVKLYVEILGGCLNAVYGDPMPDGYELDVILRDVDNIADGDPDPLPDDNIRNNLIGYW